MTRPLDYSILTVLVTGASSGIGAEFARRLAERGADLVLVARRVDRLDELAARLVDRHRVKVTVIAQDLAVSEVGPALFAAAAAGGVEVNSVVNCAGFGTFGPFHTEDAGRLAAEIAVDVSAVVSISHAFIGRLRAAGNGFLINVASMAAYQPDPNMAVYGATKAFVLSLTEALWQESKGTGLRVLALSPGATKTEFFDVVGTEAAAGGARMQTTAQVVDTALRALDKRNPGPSVAVGRLNRFAVVAGRLVSRRQMVQTMARLTAS